MDEDIRGQLDAGCFRDAFELLLARYRHKVFRLACSILGDETPAEEMAQDTFLQIWKALPTYRGEAALSTWIYAIARNRCLTHRKRSHARRAASMEEPAVLAAMEAKLAAHPERRGALDPAVLLAQLPPPYRQALQLFYLEEKSYEEVSAMLGLPIGTVKTYLHRARKQLAESRLKARQEVTR
jgi:RNA polymerase sigma-70 factor (ECF subfamily)